MNEQHAALCSSPEWAEFLQTEVLSPLLGDIDLGPNLIEVGPGPGAATEWLRRRVTKLTAVEADAPAAAKLVERFPDVELQDQVLAELARVVRPGGVIVGGDSIASERLRQFHEGDTYNPIAPGYLLDRLRELGCERVTVAVDGRMTFIAHKPETG